MRFIPNYSNLFRKIGLGGAYETSVVNSPVVRTKDRSALLADSSLDVENIGSLKYIDPRLVIRIPNEKVYISSSAQYETYRTWKFPIQEDEYIYASYKLEFPFKSNALSFIHFGNRFHDVQSNNFFKKSIDLLKKFYKNNSDLWRKRFYDGSFTDGRMAYGNIPPTVKFGAENKSIQSFDISGLYKPTAYGYNDLPFARIHFPSGNTNAFYAQQIEQNDTLNRVNLTPYSERQSIGYTSFVFEPEKLKGFTGTYFKSGSGANLTAINSKFTKSLKPSKYLIASGSFINNLGTEFLNVTGIESNKRYYLPYPNTLEKSQIHPFKCATKLAFIGNDDNTLKINGLVIVSTGNSVRSEICYVSPHKIQPLTVNTIDDFYTSGLNSIHSSGVLKKVTGYNQDSDVFQVNILDLNSNYYNYFQLPENSASWNSSNLDYSNYLSVGMDGLTVDLDNRYNYIHKDLNESISENKFLTSSFDTSHLQQVTPLKDTPFYKFYKDLYTGYKTIATGTWNGIIPSGVRVTVELISTTLNSNCGTNLDIGLIYSGHGSADPTDLEINYAYNPNHYTKVLGRTNIDSTYETMSYIGYSTANDPGEAVNHAKNNTTSKINNNIFKILKTYVPDILVFNRKYKRLKKFQNLLQKYQMQSGVIDYIPSEYKLGNSTLY